MSCLSRVRFAAATIGSTCSGRRKPAMAPFTAGLRRVQATATAPGVGVVAGGDQAQPLHQLEVLGELGLAKLLTGGLAVRCRVRLDALRWFSLVR